MEQGYRRIVRRYRNRKIRVTKTLIFKEQNFMAWKQADHEEVY